jgi:hypothetical protein
LPIDTPPIINDKKKDNNKKGNNPEKPGEPVKRSPRPFYWMHGKKICIALKAADPRDKSKITQQSPKVTKFYSSKNDSYK